MREDSDEETEEAVAAVVAAAPPPAAVRPTDSSGQGMTSGGSKKKKRTRDTAEDVGEGAAVSSSAVKSKRTLSSTLKERVPANFIKISSTLGARILENTRDFNEIFTLGVPSEIQKTFGLQGLKGLLKESICYSQYLAALMVIQAKCKTVIAGTMIQRKASDALHYEFSTLTESQFEQLAVSIDEYYRTHDLRSQYLTVKLSGYWNQILYYTCMDRSNALLFWTMRIALEMLEPKLYETECTTHMAFLDWHGQSLWKDADGTTLKDFRDNAIGFKLIWGNEVDQEKEAESVPEIEGISLRTTIRALSHQNAEFLTLLQKEAAVAIADMCFSDAPLPAHPKLTVDNFGPFRSKINSAAAQHNISLEELHQQLRTLWPSLIHRHNDDFRAQLLFWFMRVGLHLCVTPSAPSDDALLVGSINDLLAHYSIEPQTYEAARLDFTTRSQRIIPTLCWHEYFSTGMGASSANNGRRESMRAESDAEVADGHDEGGAAAPTAPGRATEEEEEEEVEAGGGKSRTRKGKQSIFIDPFAQSKGEAMTMVQLARTYDMLETPIKGFLRDLQKMCIDLVKKYGFQTGRKFIQLDTKHIVILYNKVLAKAREKYSLDASALISLATRLHSTWHNLLDSEANCNILDTVIFILSAAVLEIHLLPSKSLRNGKRNVRIWVDKYLQKYHWDIGEEEDFKEAIDRMRARQENPGSGETCGFEHFLGVEPKAPPRPSASRTSQNKADGAAQKQQAAKRKTQGSAARQTQDTEADIMPAIVQGAAAAAEEEDDDDLPIGRRGRPSQRPQASNSGYPSGVSNEAQVQQAFQSTLQVEKYVLYYVQLDCLKAMAKHMAESEGGEFRKLSINAFKEVAQKLSSNQYKYTGSHKTHALAEKLRPVWDLLVALPPRDQISTLVFCIARVAFEMSVKKPQEEITTLKKWANIKIHAYMTTLSSKALDKLQATLINPNKHEYTGFCFFTKCSYVPSPSLFVRWGMYTHPLVEHVTEMIRIQANIVRYIADSLKNATASAGPFKRGSQWDSRLHRKFAPPSQTMEQVRSTRYVTFSKALSGWLTRLPQQKDARGRMLIALLQYVILGTKKNEDIEALWTELEGGNPASFHQSWSVANDRFQEDHLGLYEYYKRFLPYANLGEYLESLGLSTPQKELLIQLQGTILSHMNKDSNLKYPVLKRSLITTIMQDLNKGNWASNQMDTLHNLYVHMDIYWGALTQPTETVAPVQVLVFIMVQRLLTSLTAERRGSSAFKGDEGPYALSYQILQFYNKHSKKDSEQFVRLMTKGTLTEPPPDPYGLEAVGFNFLMGSDQRLALPRIPHELPPPSYGGLPSPPLDDRPTPPSPSGSDTQMQVATPQSRNSPTGGGERSPSGDVRMRQEGGTRNSPTGGGGGGPSPSASSHSSGRAGYGSRLQSATGTGKKAGKFTFVDLTDSPVPSPIALASPAAAAAAAAADDDELANPTEVQEEEDKSDADDDDDDASGTGDVNNADAAEGDVSAAEDEEESSRGVDSAEVDAQPKNAGASSSRDSSAPGEIEAGAFDSAWGYDDTFVPSTPSGAMGSPLFQSESSAPDSDEDSEEDLSDADAAASAAPKKPEASAASAASAYPNPYDTGAQYASRVNARGRRAAAAEKEEEEADEEYLSDGVQDPILAGEPRRRRFVDIYDDDGDATQRRPHPAHPQY